MLYIMFSTYKSTYGQDRKMALIHMFRNMTERPTQGVLLKSTYGFIL